MADVRSRGAQVASRTAGPWLVFGLLWCCLAALPAAAQPLTPQDDPENERRFGLWLDQALSIGLSKKTSLEFEFHQRFDEGGTSLFEYFFQGGPGFRPKPWLLVIPIYRY